MCGSMTAEMFCKALVNVTCELCEFKVSKMVWKNLQPAFSSRSGHHDSGCLEPSNYCLNSADGNFLDSFVHYAFYGDRWVKGFGKVHFVFASETDIFKADITHLLFFNFIINNAKLIKVLNEWTCHLSELIVLKQQSQDRSTLNCNGITPSLKITDHESYSSFCSFFLWLQIIPNPLIPSGWASRKFAKKK